MQRLFVVVSGLPGSGKTTLARSLAQELQLPVIDKDDILENLFEAKGVGNLRWRRSLSRESDKIMKQKAAVSSEGAVLVSFWHQDGMERDTGTPTDWLSDPSGYVVNVHCECDPEIAAKRFAQRERHIGHLDDSRTYEEVLASVEEVSQLPPLEVGPRIDVDTSGDLDLADVVHEIRTYIERSND